MENTNQMAKGTWDSMTTEDSDAVKFDVNITQRVVVMNPVPIERPGKEGGVFYEFQVQHDKKDKIIQTSAWTLVREMKKANLKVGMVLDITKKIDKGKQFFVVTEVKQA